VRLPESAQPRIDALQLRWFDHHLKGVDNGVDREAPVQLYDLGSGAWHHLQDYPRAQGLRLPLASDGRACLDLEAGRLDAAGLTFAPLSAGATSTPVVAGATSAPAGAGATSSPVGAGATSTPLRAGASPVTTTALPLDIIVHDPWRPVPTVGGHLPPSMGMQERGEVDERGDVATYTTAPLAQALQLIGPVSCELRAGADTPGFDIAAVLGVVDAQGRVRNLTQGYLRCTAPGAQQVSMRHVCARIAPGERLRLSISAASYPAYAMHPGRTIAPGAVRAADYSVITLRLDPAASWLNLPRFTPDA
jgi:predicted acyl esterase